MSDWSPHALLEELAAATVMAEPGDRASLELLLGLFRSLEEAVAAGGGALQSRAASCRQTVEKVLAAGPEGAAGAAADLLGLGDAIKGRSSPSRRAASRRCRR
jgi:hypothetical protein